MNAHTGSDAMTPTDKLAEALKPCPIDIKNPELCSASTCTKCQGFRLGWDAARRAAPEAGERVRRIFELLRVEPGEESSYDEPYRSDLAWLRAIAGNGG